MKRLITLYRRSSWHPVYNYMTVGGKARSSLLFAIIVQAIVNGFTGGIFYTGLLVGYGINIVNISIITVIPSLCSVFSLLSPVVLGRFKHRRLLLSVTRIAYYAVNILGITLLPQFVHSESGRIAGLIAIVFVANVINFIFSPGYSPWHMRYITPDVRANYFSSTTLVSQISSSVVLILASILTDSLSGDAQLNLIVTLRYIAFAVALLDVYFLQKPDEPEFKVTFQRPSLLKALKIPLANRGFMLTMLVYAMYLFAMNIGASVINAWLLEEVKTTYLYINIINALYIIAIPLSSPLWQRVVQKRGTFSALAFTLFLHVPTYIGYACVTHSNYLWLMTAVRLVQHGLGMGLTFTVNNLIYVNLPEEDQDSYISLYTLIGNGTNFITMSLGTAILAAMGAGALQLFGLRFTSVPVLLLIQGTLLIATAFVTLFVRPWTDPDYPAKK